MLIIPLVGVISAYVNGGRALTPSGRRAVTPDAVRRVGACSAIFPEPDAGTAADGVDASMEVPEINMQELVGFWTVYDEQASEDAMSRLSYGGNMGSIFSNRMVLRADGQTSRGSEFPGGSWELVDGAGSNRKRLTMRLKNKVKQQEWRCDGGQAAVLE